MIDTPVIHVAFNNQDNPTYWFLDTILKSILPIYAFFYFTITGKLKAEHLMVWTFVYLAIAYVIYMTTYDNVTSFSETFSNINRTNSLAYLFIAIIPCIPLFKSNVAVQYGFFGVCLAMSLLSIKRGAIIVGVLCLLWFVRYTTGKILHSRNKLKVVIIIALIISLIYGIMYVYNHFLADNIYFAQRLEQTLNGETSGRNIITGHFLSYYSNDMNIFEKIFGIGAYGTIRTYYNFAHNDWIEILICEGALGIICYLVYWFNLYKTIKQNKHLHQVYLILSMFAIIQFFKTFFSMSIDDMSFFSTSAVGYALGQIYLYKDNQITVNEN